MLSLRETPNPPTVQPLVGSQTGQAEEATVVAESGRSDGPFSTPVKPQNWEVRGLKLGGKHGTENKRTLFSFTSILILGE